MKPFFLLLLVALLPPLNLTGQTITGELRQWHDVALTFDGPALTETGTPNPFLDYRLDVTFTQGSKTLVVPGYFAADGNAANTSANSGNKWRVHFRPPLTGTWNYTASFRQGTNVAVASSAAAGTAASFNGASGSFAIAPTNKAAPDFRAKGNLRYTGARYLQFEGTGEYFVKAGADSPENFLAYWEFDNTADYGGSSNSLTSTGTYTVQGQTYNWPGDGLHHYSPHAQHWNAGEPTWGIGKGKNIIGSINYLSSVGANAVSMLLCNINGDGRDVHPYVTYNGGTGSQADRLRFDVSKLAQWEIVFSHAEARGLFLHFKLNETENDDLFDGSFTIGTERRIYYREMVARFGHHLALNWNLGEEFGGSNGSIEPFKSAIASYAQFIHSIDPYGHPVVLHNWAGKENVRFDPHLGDPAALDGVSLQQDISTVHSKIKNYVNASKASGHNWIVCNDEQGPAHIGVEPDNYNGGNPNHALVRYQVLWGTLLAGGAGVEYYHGYSREHDDLECEARNSRDAILQDSKHALDLFSTLPFWKMEPADQLAQAGHWCLASDSVLVVYIPAGEGGDAIVNASSGVHNVTWFNPRTGDSHPAGTVTSPGGFYNFGTAPNTPSLDWVVVLRLAGAPALALETLNVAVNGAAICWQASNDLDSLVVEEFRAGAGWVQLASSEEVEGCYTVAGCEPATVRISAWDVVGDLTTSNTFTVAATPSLDPVTGHYSFPCEEENPLAYQVFDLNGRLLKTDWTKLDAGRHLIDLSIYPAPVVVAVGRRFKKHLILR